MKILRKMPRLRVKLAGSVLFWLLKSSCFDLEITWLEWKCQTKQLFTEACIQVVESNQCNGTTINIQQSTTPNLATQIFEVKLNSMLSIM